MVNIRPYSVENIYKELEKGSKTIIWIVVRDMNIAICEDELKQQQILEKMTRELHLQVPYKLQIFSSGEELIQAYHKGQKFNIILLDMQMKGINGIETGKIIRTLDTEVKIIIVTSILEYAVEGYGIKAYDFILKPVRSAKFNKVMKSAMEQLLSKNSQTYMVKTREKTCILPLTDIYYIESQGRNVIVNSRTGMLRNSENISKAEGKLVDKGFCRISRFYLINLGYVSSIGVKEVQLKNGQSLMMSIKLRNELKRRYIDYMMEVER